MERDQAWQIVCEFVSADGLRRHMLAVEAAMRWYASRLDGDPEIWGLAGLLHDFDWEVHPSLEAHPSDGAPILRERGCPDEVVQAILSHNTVGTGVERSETIDYALLACDEVTGLITASSLVRHSKDIRDVKMKSLRKRWKERSFAAGVDRMHVEEATGDFSRTCFDGNLELWDHIQNVLIAMQAKASDLGLDGRLATPPANQGESS